MNNSNRNEYVDIVRGIGILSIVVGHAFNTDNIWNSAVDGVRKFGSTPILVDKGQKGRGTASCNLPATRYIIEANPLNVLKPRAFRFAACIMELIPSQTAFVMRW